MTFCACGTEISPKTKSGRCRKCAAADPAVRAKKGKLTPEQRSARAAHARSLSADPEVVAKRNATVAKTRAKPEARAHHIAACRASVEERMKDPAYRERTVEMGRQYGIKNLRQADTPEMRERRRKAIQRAHLAWCPEEYWSHNAKLKRNGYSLAERKAIILADVKGTEERALRAVKNYQRDSAIRHQRDLEQRY